MKRLFVYALSLIVLTVAAEAVARYHAFSNTYRYHEATEVYFEDQHTLLLYLPHPTLFWTLRPNVDLSVTEILTPFAVEGSLQPSNYQWRIRTNEDGFRSGTIPVRKPENELRIFCFGDSRTLGEGLSEEETWPSRLEKRLAGHIDGSVRVINGAADGWSSYQGLELLRTAVSFHKPDVAIFCFGINDADELDGITDRVRAGRYDSPLVSLQRFLYKSVLVCILQRHANRLVAWVRGGAPIHTYRVPAQTPRVSLAAYGENVASFVRTCRREGVLPLVLLIPINPYYNWKPWLVTAAASDSLSAAIDARDSGDLEAADRLFLSVLRDVVFTRYGAEADEVASGLDAVVVDTAPAMLTNSAAFVDDMHPSARGADRIAAQLADTLAALLSTTGSGLP